MFCTVYEFQIGSVRLTRRIRPSVSLWDHVGEAGAHRKKVRGSVSLFQYVRTLFVSNVEQIWCEG